MLTITRRNLGPYRLTRFKQHETSRGVYWSGTLVCNGLPIGFIENCGDGRATQIDVADPTAAQALKDFLRVVKPQMPAHPSIGELRASKLDWEFEENFAIWLSDEAEVLKRIKRKLKKATVFVLKSDPEETTRVSPHPYSQKLADAIRAKYGTDLCFIVNEVADQFC